MNKEQKQELRRLHEMRRAKAKSAQRETDSFEQNMLTGILIIAVSIFLQLCLWFLYEKFAYPPWVLALSPLPLCLLYAAIRSEFKKMHKLTPKYLFGCSCAAPFLMCVIIAFFIYVSHPSIFVFTLEGEYSGNAWNIVSLYAGRICISSLYLGIFALLCRIFDELSPRKK